MITVKSDLAAEVIRRRRAKYYRFVLLGTRRLISQILGCPFVGLASQLLNVGSYIITALFFNDINDNVTNHIRIDYVRSFGFEQCKNWKRGQSRLRFLNKILFAPPSGYARCFRHFFAAYQKSGMRS